jgi:Family of unknown function (DUF5677)
LTGRAIFGNPAIWDDIFAKYEPQFSSIEELQVLARDIVKANAESSDGSVRILCELLQSCSEGMQDILLLVGNNRSLAAMRILRGLFETAITAEYIESNRSCARDYVDFVFVQVFRYLHIVERYRPVDATFRAKILIEYDRVSARFFNSRGRVRRRWTEKSLREIAEVVGKLNLYELAYGPASEMHHTSFMGLVSAKTDWSDVALYIGHASLLAAVEALHRAQRDPNPFIARLREAEQKFSYTILLARTSG